MLNEKRDLSYYVKFYLKNLNIFFLIYFLIDVVIIASCFINYGLFGDLINILVLSIITSSFIIYYRKESWSNFNTKIMYAIVTYTAFEIIFILFSYLYPFPNLTAQLSIGLYNDSRIYIKNIVFYSIFYFFDGLLLVIFGYFFTNWFNKKYSKEFKKIRLFYNATLIEFAGELLLLVGFYEMSIIFNSISSTGLVSQNNILYYQNTMIILGFGLLLSFIGNIGELIAFYKMFKRIHSIQNGTIQDRNLNQGLPGIRGSITPNFFSIKNENSTKIEAGFFCPHCGTKFEKDELFCSRCGANKAIIWPLL